MIDRAPLADVLRRYIEQKGYSLNRLAAESGVSKAVLHRWLNGETRRPQNWQPLLEVATTLSLDRAEANELLAAARHPSIDELVDLVERAGADEDKSLLSRWTVTGLNNLPGSVTSFIGRKEEIATLTALLHRDRLITLTGPGGSGKTRLAQKVAEATVHTFADGVYYIGLAAITDPTLVIPVIARVLGIRDASGGASLRQRLSAHLRDLHALLLLDNFEQVAAAAGDIGRLLSATRSLKVLVTSRNTLHLRGEQLFPVEPLPLPAQTSDLVALTANPAVRLFADRAQLIDHRFALTAPNALAAAEICRRVDGLPLAVELAAARVRHFSPQQLLERFPSALEIASGGPRDAPRRQQTLRATIAWSHDLLRPEEQKLFRRLAVFAGGCPEDAATEVSNLPGDEALDVPAGLDSLVENNLLRQTPGVDDERRFEMLETIREYALERLKQSGELEAARRAHADYHLSLAETAGLELEGPRQVYWLNRLEPEHDNFRAALRWCRDQGEVITGLRLCTALVHFWRVRDHVVEGRRWLESFMTGDCEIPAGMRAKALLWQGILMMVDVNAFAVAKPLFDQALDIYRKSGDLRGACEALQGHSDVALNQGEIATARALTTESLTLAREIGDDYLTAHAIIGLALCAQEVGDYEMARHHWGLAFESARKAGNKASIALALNSLGEMARHGRDLDKAEYYYKQTLELAMEIDSEFRIALALHNLGYIARYRGDYGRACGLFTESLLMYEKHQYKKGIGECLAGLAATAASEGQLERSARLCGAAEALLKSIGSRLDTLDRADYEQTLGVLRGKLDDETLAALLAEGRAMSLERAIECATKG